MKKKLLYVLAFFGVIFLFYFLRLVWGGVSSTANPSAQVQKAQCIATCSKNSLSDNCEQYCFQQSLGGK